MIKYQTKYGTTVDIDTDLFFRLSDEELDEYVHTQIGCYDDPLSKGIEFSDISFDNFSTEED